MSMNQILKWLLEQVLPFVVNFLNNLIDQYFPYGGVGRTRSKDKLAEFLKSLNESDLSNSKMLNAQIKKAEK